jgi:hypothetical protein
MLYSVIIIITIIIIIIITYLKRHDGLAKIIHQKLAKAAELIEEKAHTISTHQPMYWRITISSCTGTAAYLRTKQYLLTDLI